MQNALIAYISKFISLTEEEIKAVKEEIPIQTFKKGTILLREGEVSNVCYFNLKGLVRQYHLIDGEEKTTFFYTEEQGIADPEGAASNVPSKCYWICEEDTTLTIGKYEAQENFYKRFPKFETLCRILSEKYFGTYQDLLTSYIINSPEKRYLNLLKNRPGLIERVPQYQLASYLGIQPESLSRIRKRILVKRN